MLLNFSMPQKLFLGALTFEMAVVSVSEEFYFSLNQFPPHTAVWDAPFPALRAVVSNCCQTPPFAPSPGALNGNESPILE